MNRNNSNNNNNNSNNNNNNNSNNNNSNNNSNNTNNINNSNNSNNSNNIFWSNYTIKKIKETKKLLLHKKIMMSFIIDNYSFIDKILKYTLIISASLPILLNIIISFLEKINTNDNNTINIIIIILNTIVIGLIKIKEMSKFDKIKDIGKDQSIKYTQLYDKIEREMINKESRLSENEFLYWINREYGSIELNDPEISFTLKAKFFEECKKKNIPIQDDYKMLQDLLNEKTIYEIDIQQNNNFDIPNNTNNSINNTINPNNPINPNNNNLNNPNNNNLNNPNNNNLNNLNNNNLNNPNNNNLNNPNNNNLNNLNNSSNSVITDTLSNCSQKSQISLESALKENEYNKVSFKKLLKNFDNNIGLNWAIERLKNDY
jgi:hypothetical protein